MWNVFIKFLPPFMTFEYFIACFIFTRMPKIVVFIFKYLSQEIIEKPRNMVYRGPVIQGIAV